MRFGGNCRPICIFLSFEDWEGDLDISLVGFIELCHALEGQGRIWDREDVANQTWRAPSAHRPANGRPATQRARTDGRMGSCAQRARTEGRMRRDTQRARTDWPMADRPRNDRAPTDEWDVARNERAPTYEWNVARNECAPTGQWQTGRATSGLRQEKAENEVARNEERSENRGKTGELI